MTAATLQDGLQATLARLGVVQRDVARATGLSAAAVSRLVVHGQLPTRRAAQARQAVVRYLKQCGAEIAELRGLILPSQEKKTNPKEVGPAGQQPGEAVPVSQDANPEPKEDPMLMQKQTLSPEARAHFKLPRNPFVDDVQTPADVYQSPSVRYVRAALLDCVNHHGFLAVVGESGAGKSTLAEDLEARLAAEGREVLVVRPYVVAMEPQEGKGRPMTAGHIAEALISKLDPKAQIKSSPQKRFEQLHQLLTTSRKAGRRHLLLIEEAHSLPTATLKHLKRFLELKDGMQRLLGVALIAQPELRDLLNSPNADVREVMQRLEVVELAPLDNELQEYLRHKFGRFDLPYEQVFAPDAADAIRARLVHMPRGGKLADARSICYPLVVNNLVTRALNAAALAGWAQVDAQVIAGC